MSTAITHTDTVRPEWVDYNGHMNEAFYVVVFSHATDAVLAALDLGPAYRERTACSIYTVEAHVRYLREVAEGAALTVTSHVTGVDRKRLHICHSMAAGGEEIATEEVMALHVDQNAGRTAPFPEDVAARARDLATAPPDWAGRAIAPVASDAPVSPEQRGG